MNHNFGEKDMEFSPKAGGNVQVWQTPKYKIAKEKAIEIIESGMFGLDDGDFWILMNATKSGKMAYTGLILSHNGCLKINDCLPEEKRFRPECVGIDKDGWGGALVFTYCCPEQGIYEVGEVTKSNCKNEYPYAMAEKRLQDRVILKNSKLAYSGIYSDSESEEFAQRLDAVNAPAADPVEEDFKKNPPICERCGKPIVATKRYTVKELLQKGKKQFESKYCFACMSELAKEAQDGN